MKISKKLIFIITTIIVLIVGISLFVESVNPYYFNGTSQESIEEFKRIRFYTIVKEGDKEHQINIDFSKSEDELVGDLYIPGEYQNDLFLFWDSNINATINYSDKNGQHRISKDSKSYKFCFNKKNIPFNINIIKTSKNISPLFIEIDESLGTIESMNEDLGHNTPCYGQASFNKNDYYMSIKGRGNSTWQIGLKKPYNITFLDINYSSKQKVSMIDNIETTKWSLIANYGDVSLLRNRVGYDIANKLSVGLDTKYYDVWMNGEFLGNYLITPKNDYQATKNGFILELDNNIDYEDPQFYLSEKGNQINDLRFTVKNNNAGLALEQMQSYMQNAWEAVRNFNSEEYLNYFDLDSWATVYLLNELYKNYDVIHGSILMDKNSKDPNDKLLAGPIWDLDNALGTLSPHLSLRLDDDVNFSGGYWYISSINLEEGRYCLLQELGKHESFMKRVNEIFSNNQELFDDLINQVDINYNEAHDSFLADFNKWGNDRTFHDFFNYADWDYESKYPIYYQATNCYDDYYQNLRKYIIARVDFLDNNINNIK